MLNQMHPTLRDQVDEPVLQFFLDEIRTNLGEQAVGRRWDVKRETHDVDGVPTTTMTAKVDFARGNADCELTVRGGQIVSFSITSDKVTELTGKLGERLVKDKDFAASAGKYFAARRRKHDRIDLPSS